MISIIIPIYNAEKYLNRCIESILNQENNNWELLLINDGSIDKSGDICDHYAKMDNRISVYHKKNEGVSSARNLGLNNAKGEWIAFVDADDFVDTEYLTIRTSNACVIEKSFCSLNENNETLDSHIIKGNQFLSREEFYYHYVNHKNNALWDKIIKREIIANSRFNTDVKIGEDFLFFMTISKRIQNYALDKNGCYFYVHYKSSAMGQINLNLKKKLSYTEYNIRSFMRLTNIMEDSHYNYFVYSIIYVSIIRAWYKYRRMLTNQQRQLLQDILSKWKLGYKYITHNTTLKIAVRTVQLRLYMFLNPAH